MALTEMQPKVIQSFQTQSKVCRRFTTRTPGEVQMTKKRANPVNFDAMVKFFLYRYKIPTKRDIDNLNQRLDRIEKLLQTLPPPTRRATAKAAGNYPPSATETVLNLIQSSDDGIAISAIRHQTGYDDKKLRNILFRLNKLGKIVRVSRGHYKGRGNQ